MTTTFTEREAQAAFPTPITPTGRPTVMTGATEHHPANGAPKRVGPCAALLTIGLALALVGDFLIGFGTSTYTAPVILIGSLTSIAGYVVGVIGAWRFFTQRDHAYATLHI